MEPKTIETPNKANTVPLDIDLSVTIKGLLDKQVS